MKAIIKNGTLCGKISAPPSKSYAHRALVCAALADAPTKIALSELCNDTRATLACITAMGAEVSQTDTGFAISPIKPPGGNVRLDCQDSGATLRFLLPVAMAISGEYNFCGSEQLSKRPIAPLVSAMKKNGVVFDAEALPLSVSGVLTAGTFEIAGDISSQLISGLLLALPLLSGDSEIVLKSPLRSAPYIEMTLDIMRIFGVKSEKTSSGFFVRGGQSYHSPGNITVEGDWSGAAFFLAAGALGGEVSVSNLQTNSKQADVAIIELLRRFGAEPIIENDSVSVKASSLHGCDIDLSNSPDLFPILSVLGTAAEGRTRLLNCASQRFKESDRLFSCAAMVNSLGGRAFEHGESLELFGTALNGGTVNSFADHRVAMSAAIAACACAGKTEIIGAEAINKSYPAFFEDFLKLGGRMKTVDLEENQFGA
ncbi:MAG: 3-phosphoshikimate 1-carboxyvinyltransferase [Oscillospiraceae bacterium]